MSNQYMAGGVFGCDSFRDETYGDVKTSGNNVRGRIIRGQNVRGHIIRGQTSLYSYPYWVYRELYLPDFKILFVFPAQTLTPELRPFLTKSDRLPDTLTGYQIRLLGAFFMTRRFCGGEATPPQQES
jgi:hypothetical protein